jgi:surface protein
MDLQLGLQLGARISRKIGEIPDPNFVILIKTDNVGTTNSTSIGLPVAGTFDIDWGDGSSETITGAVATTLTTHDYGVAGEYTISVGIGLDSIKFGNANDKLKVLQVKNLGSTGLTTLVQAFYGCANLTTVIAKNSLTTNITSMSAAFFGCGSLTTIDLSGTDLSNVTTMADLCGACTSLGSVNFTDTTTTEKLTSIRAAFYQCSSLTTLDLSSSNISGLTSMAFCLESSSVDTESYSKLLIDFANKAYTGGKPFSVDASFQTGRTYNNTNYGGTPFNNAVDARSYLVGATGSGGAGWTITGDAQI